ncbi:MAG TPA: Ig-like domain repeat protein [Granulicella sp.]
MRLPSFCRFRLFFLCLLALTSPAVFAQSGLVISQMYGGGGNSGAPYTYDYLELYNPTGSAISLNGLSFQYASSSGTSWNTVVLPNASVAAGHYFLIQGSAGSASPGNLPVTPDFVTTSAPNFSATTGKIALVDGTAALSGACPTGANVVDFLGYGTANCFLGSGDAPAPSNTTADIRNGYTNNNAADFTTGTPNPHNSSFGSSPAGLSATGLATPSTVTSGSQVLLTVTVVPATNPASTGITVTADLSTIGGTSTQAFYDDGTHGDATAGDNVFSFETTATASKSGTVSLPVAVADAESASTSTSVSLTINLPVVNLPIHTIQGSRSLTATSVSPYAGQTVTTEGIVTGIGSAGYFIQSRDVDADSDPSTPEGVYIYTGTGKVPATAVVGNYVQVTGAVSTYPAVASSHTPATEIASTSATVLATGQPLPTPVTITSSMLTPSGGLYQLTPYEGMRVSIASLTTTSGTDGSLTSEVTETEKSNGQFYAVLTGTPRPFREPGIDIRDPQTGLPPDAAKFDDNPERILVDSAFLGSTAIDLSTGAVLPNVTGILDFTYSSDSYYDPSRLVLDPSYDKSKIAAGMSVQPAPPPASTEFRVAAYNIERFFNTNSADDIDFNPVTGKTENSSAVDVTQTAYNNRLAKVSLAIRDVLGSPDIVTLEEVENQSVAADIAAKISSDATAAGEPDPQYVAYGTGTSYAPYTNDVGGISVGFLVKSGTVDTINIAQMGATTLFTDPRDGTTQQTLNDRPPLVLHAGIKRGDAKDYPITVIVNHLRSLSDENDPSSGIFVRTKKELQAEFLANLIQGYQSAGEHVISGGDYNAFEFSDGYIDILATITNQNVLPSDQVVDPGVAGLVTPPAVDLATLLPSTERWSYQEYGNAQILDHIVATSDLVSAGAHLAYAHLDADQPLAAYNDPTTPARTSDHDAAVGYFTLPAPVLSATLTGNGAFGSVNVGSASSGQSFTLTNTGEGNINISGIAATGDFSQVNNCGISLAVGATCGITVVFSPTTAGPRAGTLTVTAAGGSIYSASLTGTGVPVYDAAISVKYASTHLVYPGATNVTACVTPASATGTFKIYDGTTLLTTRPIQGGGCAYWYISPGLAAGTHQLSAAYSGDRNNPAGTSVPTTIVVDPVPVYLSVACGNLAFSYGGNYECTVLASSDAGPATGTISYKYDGGGAVAVPVSNGYAQFKIAEPVVGSHTVSIAYAQQGNYAAAAAAPVQKFTVTAAPVFVAVVPSNWYPKAGTNLTLRATVNSYTGAGAPKAIGSVSFTDGSTLLGTVPVDGNGQASFSTSNLSPGIHTIIATYSNGANYATGSGSDTIIVLP